MSHRKQDEITREFWRRVRARNGFAPQVMPPPRIPVDFDATEDHGMPWVVAGVLVMLVAGLVYVGWTLAVGALLAGATWGGR